MYLFVYTITKFIEHYLFMKKKTKQHTSTTKHTLIKHNHLGQEERLLYIGKVGKTQQKHSQSLPSKTTLEQTKNYNHVSCIFSPFSSPSAICNACKSGWACPALFKHEEHQLSPCSRVRPALPSSHHLVSVAYQQRANKVCRSFCSPACFPSRNACLHKFSPALHILFCLPAQLSNRVH